MADIISRLKLESGEFDSKIKRAGQEIMAYSEHCRKMGLEMGYANKDAKDFAKSLGSMQTVSTSARGKINELSDAFVNLKVMYKNLTDEEKNNTFGKNLAASLDQLKVRIQNAKKDLSDVTAELNGNAVKAGGGGLLAGLGGKMEGALAVFGGNLMTKAAGAVASLGSEMFNSVQQGIELARQGEGIRVAFERLGNGQILQGLREATHGTVTDIELMKAAVKFNDFKLPVEELGTMLAFAQQKAKDTGQSVDYMVDSIVTGLGRKSLMILDNLGLSATEVKEKMKETGDMTKAVGQIIREQMAKAGDYVETAADRAAQANVNLQNKMEELGRKFAPVEEASSHLWTSMKIGILDIIGGPLADLLNKLTQAGRMANAYGLMGGNAKVGRMTANLAGASEGKRQSIYQQQQEQFWRYINPREQQIRDIRAWQSGDRNEALQKRIGAITEKYGSLDATKIQAEVDAAKKMLSDYQAAAKQILQPVNINTKQAEQNVASLRKQLKELEEQRKKAIKAGDQEQVENLTKQISQVKNNIGYLDPNALKSNKTIKTEIQKNEEKIKKLSVEYAKLGDSETEAARKRQAEIQKEIELLQQRNGLLGLRAEQAQGRLKLKTSDFAFGGASGDGLLANPFASDDKSMNTKGSLGLQLDPSVLASAQKDADSYIDLLVKGAKQTEKAWGMAGQAVQGIGSAFAMIDDPAAKVAGTVMQAIASVALGFAMASKSADTVASGWGWLAWLGAGATAMATTIATIHSLTGYASGGVIKGNSYSGDNIVGMVDGGGLVGLNAGEIVLNKAQTANVANELTNNQPRAMRVNGRISGHDIVLAADRSLAQEGKGHIVTWK